MQATDDGSRPRPIREVLLEGSEIEPVSLPDLCRRSAALVGAAGAVLLLVADGDIAVAEASDAAATRCADLEATRGEGPTLDALATREPVISADLAHDDRWPELSVARPPGVRATVATPLLADSTILGALTVYFAAPGVVSAPTLARVSHVARVLTGVLLRLPVAPSARNGLARAISLAADHQARVHQAAGIISVDEGCTIGEALLLLRAHAYAHDQQLADIAAEVIDHGLRLRS